MGESPKQNQTEASLKPTHWNIRLIALKYKWVFCNSRQGCPSIFWGDTGWHHKWSLFLGQLLFSLTVPPCMTKFGSMHKDIPVHASKLGSTIPYSPCSMFYLHGNLLVSSQHSWELATQTCTEKNAGVLVTLMRLLEKELFQARPSSWPTDVAKFRGPRKACHGQTDILLGNFYLEQLLSSSLSFGKFIIYSTLYFGQDSKDGLRKYYLNW